MLSFLLENMKTVSSRRASVIEIIQGMLGMLELYWTKVQWTIIVCRHPLHPPPPPVPIVSTPDKCGRLNTTTYNLQLWSRQCKYFAIFHNTREHNTSATLATSIINVPLHLGLAGIELYYTISAPVFPSHLATPVFMVLSKISQVKQLLAPMSVLTFQVEQGRRRLWRGGGGGGGGCDAAGRGSSQCFLRNFWEDAKYCNCTGRGRQAGHSESLPLPLPAVCLTVTLLWQTLKTKKQPRYFSHD